MYIKHIMLLLASQHYKIKSSVTVIPGNFGKWLDLELFFALYGHPRRDTRRGSVLTMRYKEEKMRRIIDVGTIASLNQAADLRKTPGIIVFGPLSSVAAHGGRFCRKPFRKFWLNHRAWGPAHRQTASSNALKIRTRRRGLCPHL